MSLLRGNEPHLIIISVNIILISKHKKHMSRGEAQNCATEELILLCERAQWNPDLSLLKRLILDGADICGNNPKLWIPLLHTFVGDEKVEVIKVCLDWTPNVMDFSVVGKDDKTVFHHLLINTSREQTIEILKIIVRRLETHPEDRVDWKYVDLNGYNFISLAARYQKLSAVWPIILDQPYFSDQVEPLSLCGTVWKWDLDCLNEEEKQCFQYESTHLEDADGPTAKLIEISSKSNPNMDEWKGCISDGANIFYLNPESLTMIFHQCVWKGQMEAIKACLKTPTRIDFSTEDLYRTTVLEYIWANNKSPDTMLEIFELLLIRLQDNPLDIIDWSRTDSDGDSLLSLVTVLGLLSQVWELLKKYNVSFFTNHIGPIRISRKVKMDDWNNITPEDKRGFLLAKGFR